MVGKYKVVTLCGSTRFKDEYLKVQKELTLRGYIVLSCGLFGHSGDREVWTEGTKEMLDDMHKRKIDMSDEIFVVDPGGYIGESTKSEICYAMLHGKNVRFLEDPGHLYWDELVTSVCADCRSLNEIHSTLDRFVSLHTLPPLEDRHTHSVLMPPTLSTPPSTK